MCGQSLLIYELDTTFCDKTNVPGHVEMVLLTPCYHLKIYYNCKYAFSDKMANYLLALCWLAANLFASGEFLGC